MSGLSFFARTKSPSWYSMIVGLSRGGDELMAESHCVSDSVEIIALDGICSGELFRT